MDCIQRLKGPQPSKKGRTPGPGWEGNGAGRFGQIVQSSEELDVQGPNVVMWC